MAKKKSDRDKGTTPPEAVAAVTGDPQPKLGDEFVINCNFMVATGPAVFVVKAKSPVDGKEYYARFPNAGPAISVHSKRLASRFDSSLWAQTLAGQLSGGRVVRLLNKAEREHKEAMKKGPTQYRFQAGVKEAFAMDKKTEKK